MPRKKRKTREERATEEYFPIDSSDLRYTVEKIAKQPERMIIIESKSPKSRRKKEDSMSIEKKSKKPVKKTSKKGYKKQVKKKAEKIIKDSPNKKRSKKSSDEFVPKKIKLKKEGYELIITEKPQAAQKIASSLGKSVKKVLDRVSYYEIDRDGEKIVVVCAVGHLFTLKQKNLSSNSKNGKNSEKNRDDRKDKEKTNPVFDIHWVPNYMVRKKDFTKRYYNLILKLAKGAKSVTVATDYDVEGEVIGLNIVRFICGQEDAKRMKFSTLTPPEINKAYEEKSQTLNWGQAIAGETRHYLDWIYGINLSRILMDSIKTTGKFRIMSIGRVQGPTLNIIVQKERKIDNFKSKKYWQIFAKVKEDVKNIKEGESNDDKQINNKNEEESKKELELKYVKDVFDENQLTIFDNLKGQKAKAETKKKIRNVIPNPPFNLTALQTEVYRFYGITPIKTLQIAQSLYLNGLISYPRTSSQKLPVSIAYKTILKKIAKEYNVEHLIKRETPIEGKKSDPAHPSIYPTGESIEIHLSTEEKKIYDLIAKRFLALFCEDAEINNKSIKAATSEGMIFSTNGSSIVKKGWIEIYPSGIKEKELPDLEGDVEIREIRKEEKETQPPKRYSPASIVSELEKENLGTKATRASILETLYDRGYIQNKNIEATPLGKSLIETLEKYSPVIIDKKLTREFEKDTDIIIQSKSNFLEKEKIVIEKAKKTIIEIMAQFEKNKEKVGIELLEANAEYREQQKKENTLLPCPICEKGNLIINYSKKNRRYFVSCDSYPDCTNTYTLPPNGAIKRTEKICEECNYPILIRLSKGKRPWEFCFNPECPKNKERIEEYRKSLS